MRIFNGLDELVGASGEVLGTSDWITVEQERVDGFADATDDHQWIHVDVERAKDGPFGRTIAHGFLTLSLLPVFFQQIYRVDGLRMAVNYGLNKVRFPAPVPVGSKLRATSRLVEVTPLDGATQIVLSTTIEAEGVGKPVCVAESVVRYFA
ncbi:MaoC family dehydratase [Streptosporangium sp. NBC_01810]|uniref:MaoC family dehydratase n=1 Tax=Streptosporangium sp. NBC_01810 TaxID=2975951 RepID=UPI002DD90AEE|nr:MaoC family dehydratase [Streptosporangium sp. NBC_01810]WSA28993.1 MaoC family dehydratase [Streptosporangium sp. NBC_01810]